MKVGSLVRRVGGAGVVALALFAGGAAEASASDCGRDALGGGSPFSVWDFDADAEFDDATLFSSTGSDLEREDAFDGYGVVQVGGDPYVNPNTSGCVRAQRGRDVTFPADTIPVPITAQVVAKPQLYVSNRRSFGRQFVSLRNPGDSPITIDFAWDGDLGSNGSTVVGPTSSGDSSMNQGDRWGTTCEDDDGDGCANVAGEGDRDPEIAHNWEGKGAKGNGADLVFDPELTEADLFFEFQNVTIGAGETVTFMQVVSIATTIKAAGKAARAIDKNPQRYGVFAGLSKQERKRLQNW
jgi:hypothetical protein